MAGKEWAAGRQAGWCTAHAQRTGLNSSTYAHRHRCGTCRTQLRPVRRQPVVRTRHRGTRKTNTSHFRVPIFLAQHAMTRAHTTRTSTSKSAAPFCSPSGDAEDMTERSSPLSAADHAPASGDAAATADATRRMRSSDSPTARLFGGKQTHDNTNRSAGTRKTAQQTRCERNGTHRGRCSLRAYSFEYLLGAIP